MMFRWPLAMLVLLLAGCTDPSSPDLPEPSLEPPAVHTWQANASQHPSAGVALNLTLPRGTTCTIDAASQGEFEGAGPTHFLATESVTGALFSVAWKETDRATVGGTPLLEDTTEGRYASTSSHVVTVDGPMRIHFVTRDALVWDTERADGHAWALTVSCDQAIATMDVAPLEAFHMSSLSAEASHAIHVDDLGAARAEGVDLVTTAATEGWVLVRGEPLAGQLSIESPDGTYSMDVTQQRNGRFAGPAGTYQLQGHWIGEGDALIILAETSGPPARTIP